MDGTPKATEQIADNTNNGDFKEGFNEHFKQWKQGKYRDFLLTLNCEINNDKDKSRVELLKKLNNLMKYLTSLKYTYILSSLELNKKDFYHVHIFIQFNNPHKLSTSKIEGAHINIINKTINQVIDYVKKDGVILKELGTPRYITGNPSIKDISLSRFSDINENGNAKYYRVYKEIKKDNQGLINCNKNIYIIDDLNNLDLDKFSNYNYFQIDETGKIKRWPHNMILERKLINKNNIECLLRKNNKPIQYKFFANDIENIIFELKPNKIEDNVLLNEIAKYDNHTINYLYETGELDEEPDYTWHVIDENTEFNPLDN